MTYMEVNTLWYVAGYIPRMLRKRLQRSRHRLRDDLSLCLLDLLDNGDEEHNDSKN